MLNQSDKKGGDRKQRQGKTNISSSTSNEKAANPKNNDDNNDNSKNWTQIIVAVIGLVGVITAALIGKFPTTSQTTYELSTQTIALLTDTPISPTAVPFSEVFNNNDRGWDIDQGFGDFNAQGYKTFVHISNGKYYREVESNDTFVRAFGARPIPYIYKTNLCLIFDARVFDSPQNTAVVIIVRADDWRSYYYIGFNAKGGGTIRLTDRQIDVWENGISWTDEQTHTVKISLQDDKLEVYDEQTNTLLNNTTLLGEDIISNNGQIKFGLQLFRPNQKATVEFDNIYVYDKCP